MGHVSPTPAGHFRADWRDATGRKKTKTFKTRKEAKAFLAETETALGRGIYVDPHAGRVRFGEFADRWSASRVTGNQDQERTRIALRKHILPKWGNWPIGKMNHLAIQEWVRELSEQLAPATVAKCLSTLSKVLRSAVRSRLIAVDPSEGVTAPAVRFRSGDRNVIDMRVFVARLLPAVPAEHRALVAAAAGAGLRWGECAGLAWGCVDLDRDEIRVTQVAEEVSGAVVIRQYPKTRASVRTVPMAPFLVAQLRARLAKLPAEPDPGALVFATRTGTPPRRSNFRRQVWRPAQARAGLLGQVDKLGEHKYRAVWSDAAGVKWSAEFTTKRDAERRLAERAHGGLRFHDLRHSYATWLVSAGVPVNDVAAAVGHENPSITLRLYTHRSDGRTERIMKAFPEDLDPLADFPPTESGESDTKNTTEEGNDGN